MLHFFEAIWHRRTEREQLESTRLRDKVDDFAILKIVNTDEGVCRVDPSSCRTELLAYSENKGYAAVKRLFVVGFMHRLISRPKLVRILISVREHERIFALWSAEHLFRWVVN